MRLFWASTQACRPSRLSGATASSSTQYSRCRNCRLHSGSSIHSFTASMQFTIPGNTGTTEGIAPGGLWVKFILKSINKVFINNMFYQWANWFSRQRVAPQTGIWTPFLGRPRWNHTFVCCHTCPFLHGISVENQQWNAFKHHKKS